MPAHGTRPRPRRTFRCALLALVLLASALSATTARAASGQITGLVTDATGQPVAGLAVDAYSYARSAEYGAITGSDGRYVIRGLPTDAYTVEFHPRPGGPDYQVTYYDQQAGAGGVNVTDGQTTSGIDAQVQAGPPYGQITGTVRDAGGAPLENIDVVARVMPDDVAWPVAVTTDASGHYAMSNLPAGVYDLVLSSEPRAAVTFGLQRVRGVTVTSGATTGGADAILAPGG
ncbi:MAG TPA: carboxypeptidase-like regulatory domain-containing protein, partial [Solirubrobacteraceae bacterium]|nr:carboxypeptidase-like regulatory domain-containing protein [Solirubrobacteraceae bacterium]